MHRCPIDPFELARSPKIEVWRVVEVVDQRKDCIQRTTVPSRLPVKLCGAGHGRGCVGRSRRSSQSDLRQHPEASPDRLAPDRGAGSCVAEPPQHRGLNRSQGVSSIGPDKSLRFSGRRSCDGRGNSPARHRLEPQDHRGVDRLYIGFEIRLDAHRRNDRVNQIDVLELRNTVIQTD